MQYPRHIGFIPDGNRTRSTKNDVAEIVGYLQGMQRGIDIARYVITKTPIQAITGWLLSTENVSHRSAESLAGIFDMVKKTCNSLDELLESHRVNFRRIGSETGLPSDFVDFLQKKEADFAFGTDRSVCFAVNYGGQDEIVRAIHRASQAGEDMSAINSQTLHGYTDIGSLPPLDMVIRTKSEVAQRTSGFASWAIGYAELYFSDVLCPDFGIEEFEKSLAWFDSIAKDRNFGK